MGVSLRSALEGLTLLLTLAWVLSEVYLRYLAHAQGAPAVVGRGKDRGSHLVLGICLVAYFVVILVDHRAPVFGTLPVWALAVGNTLMVLGITIRVWAVSVLGRFFTTVVTLQPGHRLVTSGPYRVVRHPSYTGALLTLLGFPVAMNSLLGLLVGAVLIAISFGYRIHVEEQVLLAGLGAEYEAYQRRTHRLIPGIY